MEKITFSPDGGEPIDFYVLEQTIIGVKSYILVTDSETGDGEALILRDDSDQEADEAEYSMIEDDKEFEAVGMVFEKLLDDDGIDLEF